MLCLKNKILPSLGFANEKCFEGTHLLFTMLKLTCPEITLQNMKVQKAAFLTSKVFAEEKALCELEKGAWRVDM